MNLSSAHTNFCMRQQHSGSFNVRISQFAADFCKKTQATIKVVMNACQSCVPFQNFGRSDTEEFMECCARTLVQHAGRARSHA
jgi:hypothetical protein